MSLFNKHERRNIRESRFLRDHEMEEQYYVVTNFYPAQQLTITLKEDDVKEFMNCDWSTASELLKKVGKKIGKDTFFHKVRTSEFCDHLGIEATLVHLFLASLKEDGPLPPVRTINKPVITDRPWKISEVVDDLRQGIMESSETLALRAKFWDEANPWGEAMFKRKKWVQMVIRAFEVAQIYGCHISTAQQMLREVRDKDRENGDDPDKKQRRYVSIKKFCAVHNEDEEDLRKHLADLHGDDEEEEDD
ncbi:hypothetical protein [Longitalea luteola]|uniref:hypothetical protein n=1 Tax=Longitalea luteola TaxID=2812563 RepID=UPI001A956811|nr:hypothetical protein [Longitalea luteola]